MRNLKAVKPRLVSVDMLLKLEELGTLCIEIDEVINFLRVKYNVHIYNSAAPFVCEKGYVLYGFSVKKCNPKWGWNCRTHIGSSKWRRNIYDAKREAIKIAVNWILNQQNNKVSKKKRKNGTNKKQN